MPFINSSVVATRLNRASAARRHVLPVAAAVAVSLVTTFMPVAARAQTAASDWPSRPVTLVVGYAAGGGVDFMARLLAEKLSERLRQPVVVENRPSVGAVVGSTQVARAKPDGYTLMMGAPGPVIFNHALNDKLPYGPQDLAPISIMSDSPLVLLVNATNPATTVKALVAQSQAQPDKSNYAASSASFQLASELFNKLTGARFAHIPYKGANQSVQAVMGGEVTMALADSGPAITGLQSGKLRALAVTSAQRMSGLPEVPTMRELGIDLTLSLWIGLLAPAGTPTDIINRLHREIVAINQLPDVRAKILAKGSVPATLEPAAFAQLIAREIPFWRQLARDNGIQGN
jgi:tripartite-type tricarboxylate transporter receptor subunit TctC